MNLIEKIIDQIYPTVCGMCGRLYKESICNRCMKKLQKELICKVHYKYYSGEFVKRIYLFRYKDELRNIFLSYKFNERNYLYDFFVQIILKNKDMNCFLRKYDVIIPVPLYYKNLNKRGYNQCGLISKGIAKVLENIEYRGDVLIKSKNILKQSSLTEEERKRNVRDAYMIKNFEKNWFELQNKNILIFDDICTTGNTINECTRVLKELEPKSIGVFTIFKN